MRYLSFVWMMTLYIMLSAVTAHALDAAQDCAQAKNPKDVIAGCTELINSDAGNDQQRSEMFYLRGQAHAKLNQLDQALHDYSEAVDLAPDRVEIYLDRGDVRRWQKNYDGAKQDYEQVIDRVARDIQSEEIESDADRKIALLLQQGGAYLGLGFLFRAQGDLDRANERFDKCATSYGSVIDESSTNIEAYVQRARVFQIQYRYKQASADYDQAASLLEAQATKVSDQDEVKQIQKEVKDWRNEAEYSRTMAELDKRFEEYLKGIEKDNAFPNWSQPPWTTFRRVHLHEEIPPAPTPAPVAEITPQPSGEAPVDPSAQQPGVQSSSPWWAYWTSILLAVLGLLLVARRKVWR